MGMINYKHPLADSLSLPFSKNMIYFFSFEPVNNTVLTALESILCLIVTIKYSESKDHKKIYLSTE